jgi:hypothetical protein|nr:MAG TPA: tail tube protein [Caudoviricetes sp.]
MTTPGEIRRLGPGVLKFGETATAAEFSARCSNVEVAPTISSESTVALLDGSDYVPEGSPGGEISGKVYQDYTMDGLVAWSWKQAGKTLPFVYQPVKAEKLQVKGKCVIQPIKIGGDVKKTNDSDFKFALVGMPDLVEATATPQQ